VEVAMLTKEELIELVMRSWCDEEGDLNLRLEVNLEDGWYITEEELRSAIIESANRGEGVKMEHRINGLEDLIEILLDVPGKEWVHNVCDEIDRGAEERERASKEFHITEEEEREAVETWVGPDRSAETKRVLNIIINDLFDVWPSDLLDDSEEGEGYHKDMIDPDGVLHSSERVEEDGVHDCQKRECIDCTEPLRVRVDSEDQARELADLCTDAGFDVHWFMDLDLASHLHIEPSKNNADIWHNSDKEHDVEWNDRKPQVRKYIKYHSTEDDMTEQTDDELTHEPYQADYPDDAADECAFCGNQVSHWNDPCPEHPDREDDNELRHDLIAMNPEGDMSCKYCDQPSDKIDVDADCPELKRLTERDSSQSTEREIAERFLEEGDWVMELFDKETVRVPVAVLHALRSQLELADDDGVCGWRRETEDPTAYPQYYGSECDYERKLSDEDLSTDTYCPGCGKPIEMVEEGEEYSVGDLWRIKYDGEWLYLFCTGKDEEKTDWMDNDGDKYESTTGITSTPDENELEKVGHFHPTPKFFERVPDWVTGELVIEHMPDGHDRVGLWPGTEPGDIDYGVLNSKGESRAFTGEMTERTGIIVSAEQLESLFCEEE
jgi:hypothetical protein